MPRYNYVAAAILLCATSSTSFACTLPSLVAIPPRDKVGDQGPAIRDSTTAYFEQMKVFTDCIQADLTAAGGDQAPTLTKSLLIARNNSAVAEAEAVKKLFEASVGLTAVPAATFNQGPPTKKDQKGK
jgi:hypothetical protein